MTAAARRAPLAVLVLAAAVSLPLAATASARTVGVPKLLGAALPDAGAVGVPVLLPSTIDLDYGRGAIYGEASGVRKGRYTLSLSAARGCDGASACFLAAFTGRRGAPLATKSTNVKLALGLKGRYVPTRCGASCAPASIAWVQKGVRYEIEAKALGGRAAFVRWADSAIHAGDRGQS